MNREGMDDYDPPSTPDLYCRESPSFLYDRELVEESPLMKRERTDEDDPPSSPDLYCRVSPSFLNDGELVEESALMKRERTDGDDPPPSPDLFCRESPSFLYDRELVEESAFVNLNNYYDIALGEEHLQDLIDREIKFGFKKDEDLAIDNWVLDARLEALTWVLKRRAALGFHSRTAYLSMTYFDRFISLRATSVNQTEAVIRTIRLLSVACLSLAAKMEEVSRPSLSKYEVEDYHFESKLIQKRELVVLRALDWRMNLITPFAFLDYFISKLCQESPSNVKSRIESLLLSIMAEINLMHHRPSAIAAAATLMASDQKLTKEALDFKIKSVPDLIFLEIEAVFSCYNLLQQLEVEKPKAKISKTD